MKPTLINSNNIQTVKYMAGQTAGKFRFISKCRAGWLTISESRDFDNARLMKHPETLISGFKKGSLHTVEFCPEGTDFYLTVFAKKGKKIAIIDEEILRDLTVGTINSTWINTDLYSMNQYHVVNAKTWADKAYVINQDVTETV